MVLIHGIGSELCVWEPIADELASRYELIALDLPGFGRSKPLADGVVPTPVRLAATVIGLLDELGIDRVHAVGNSLGGWVALELAALGRALSVTALCPAGLWKQPVLRDGAIDRGAAQRLARRLRPVIPLVMLSSRARRLALSAFVARPERVPYSAATRMIRSYGRATAYQATSTAMRQNFFTAMDRIVVPVTLAFGERDRLIRPAQIQAGEVRSILLPGCGHIPMWDAPELVARTIEQTARRAAPTLPRQR